jgi:hypothetical protein
MAISFDQAYPVLYQGWDRTAAQADFNATGGSNKAGYQDLVNRLSGGGSSGGVPNTSSTIDTAKQLLQFQQQANQPAISSLQASIPEISSKYASEKTRLSGEKTTLQDRYQNLLGQINANQEADIKQQEIATAREFGRRGIPTTSGLAEQTLAEKLSPIRKYYTGQTTEAGISNEQGLRSLESLIANLTGSEVEAQRAVQNAIAQLQAGDSSGAVLQALSLLQSNQSAQQSAAEQAWREKVYNETTVPESYASIQNLMSQISNRGASGMNNDPLGIF